MKRLIGFGDSLTWGFCNNGLSEHPYSIQLNHLLKSNNLNYVSSNLGFNGETTEFLNENFPIIFPEKNINEGDIFLIFGGANDLASNSSPKQIAQNLNQISKHLLKFNNLHFFFTLPGCECDTLFEGFRKQREELNKEIRLLSCKEKVLILDLDKEIKYHELSEPERKKYWDDYVHFSAQGYDLMATSIFNNIKNYLMN